jgi:hypothetical protein
MVVPAFSSGAARAGVFAALALAACHREVATAPVAVDAGGGADAPAHRAAGDAPESGPITDLVICGRNQSLQFEGRTFEVEQGPALIAGGSCTVTLTHCSLVAHHTKQIGVVYAGAQSRIVLRDCTIAGDLALSAGGSAVVEVEGGAIEGSEAAVSALGQATVRSRGAKVTGKVEHKDQAVLEGL